MASPLTRRDLFGIFRKSVESAKSGPLPLRPPGAVGEERISDMCARCGACMDVCPRQAIKPLPTSFGERAGTPFIVARVAPCVLCTGLQCTKVCPSGALMRIEEPTEVKMGRALLDQGRCLPWQGTACSTCVTSCPIPGALSVDEKGRPRVNDACTGCGLCEYYCPTPTASIRVRPRASK